MTERHPPPLPYATPTTAPTGRKFGHLIGWALFIGLAIVIFLLMKGQSSAGRGFGELPLSEFYDLLEAGEIANVRVEGDRLFSERRTTYTSRGGLPHRKFRTVLPIETSRQWTFIQWLLENRKGAVVRVENDPNLLLNIFIPLIPWLLVFAFIWFVVFRQLRKAGGTGVVLPVTAAVGQPAAPVANPSAEAR
jgi:ATP-dependent Zn protease